MASLIEELITVMRKEEEEYRVIYELAKKKTPIIVSNDIEALKELSKVEQDHLSKVVNYEKKRIDVVKDIAIVLNKDVKTLKVKDIIKLLENQKKEQKQLSEARDKLKVILRDLEKTNELNKNLIKESLDMIEFNLNLVKGAHQLPQTANYSRSAANVPNSAYFRGGGGFDAKQ